MKAELFYPDVFNFKGTLKDQTLNLQQLFRKEPNLESEEIKGKLLQSLLLYDSILINGWDLPVVIHFFNGRENAEFLVEAGLLRLLNASDIFLGCQKEGYFYTLAGGHFIRDKFSNADEINICLQSFRGNDKDYIQISESLFDNRLEVDTDDIIKKISKEIIKDIFDKEFRNKYNLTSTKATHILSKDVQAINTLIEAYRRIYISERANIKHIFSEDILESVIKDKLIIGFGNNITKTDINSEFRRLTNIIKVPDIVEAVRHGIFSTKDVLKIREKKNCSEFRKWLHSNASFELSDKDNQDIISAYIDALGKKDVIDKLPIKILRFVSTSLLGMIPFIGGAASFIDSFVIDNLRTWKPNIFIDDYKKQINKK